MYKITDGLEPKKLIDIFQKMSSSQNYIIEEALPPSSICLNLRLNILNEVLVAEEQNCGIASQTSREVYNLSITLIQVCETRLAT